MSDHSELIARLEAQNVWDWAMWREAIAALREQAGELRDCKARYQDLGAIAGPLTAERDTLRAELAALKATP